jgi:hypothetical protein
MRLISLTIAFVFLFVSTMSLADDVNGLTKDYYDAAKQYGFKNKIKLRNEYDKAKDETPVEAILEHLNRSYDKGDWELTVRKQTDQTLQIIFRQIDVILRHKGHNELADKLASEFTFYKDYLVNQYFGEKELGDHPPMSEWLEDVHNNIEDAIGAEWCKFWHLHDLEIINHAIPVVMDPKKYDLKEYKDHFSGHHIFRFQWEHHGLAGVITYWLVNIACIYGTSGIGVISFACSAVAAGAEHVMDKKIAPPIAERIWFRYNT